MNNQSDLKKLMERLETFLEATERARGTSGELQKAAPLEIHLYNIATKTKNELTAFKAMVDDFNGVYGQVKPD